MGRVASPRRPHPVIASDSKSLTALVATSGDQSSVRGGLGETALPNRASNTFFSSPIPVCDQTVVQSADTNNPALRRKLQLFPEPFHALLHLRGFRYNLARILIKPNGVVSLAAVIIQFSQPQEKLRLIGRDAK